MACNILGCGHLTATSYIDDADRALMRAHAADADRYAAYEVALADLYLAKAREEQGHAQYGDARALADDALRYANAAGRKAADRKSGEARSPAVSSK
jgi:hypothetical protein